MKFRQNNFANCSWRRWLYSVSTSDASLRNISRSATKGHHAKDVYYRSNGLCGTLCLRHKRGDSKCLHCQQVTLHPMFVVWMDPGTHELKHKSYTVVLANRNHNCVAEYAFLKAVLSLVNIHLPQIEDVNYLTISQS